MNIVESRRRIHNGVDNTHGLLSGWCAVVPHQDEQKRFCLSPTDVAAVAELAKSIEARIGKPVRVEWAFERGTLYVVDARRISQ
jgi:phosphoenolpyruvate synthase/pyruvate phosphate dikinase